MPPEQKNGSAKKLKRQDGEARAATARKANARPAKDTRTRSASVSNSASPKAANSPARPAPSAPPASSKRSVKRSVSTKRPTSAATKRPTVAIVGAGRLGSAFALALSRSGYAVVALVARRAHHARRAARSLSPQPLALGVAQLDALPETDLLLITTPDDRITEVASLLASVFAARDASAPPISRRRRAARVALHASGALDTGALAPLGAHAFSLGSLHPLVSINEPASGASNLRGAFYCLEGEARARAAANKIVRALGGHSFSVAARSKPLYHASAVMCAGHLVALFSLATEMLARCGLSRHQAARVLLPLASGTLANLARGAQPASALTGPFARADVATLRRHLSALREFDARETLPVYVALGRHALQLARTRGGDDAAVRAARAEMEALLEDTL